MSALQMQEKRLAEARRGERRFAPGESSGFSFRPGFGFGTSNFLPPDMVHHFLSSVCRPCSKIQRQLNSPLPWRPKVSSTEKVPEVVGESLVGQIPDVNL